MLAADFLLNDVSALLAQFNGGGLMVFAMEAATSTLLAASNGINTVFTSADGTKTPANAVEQVSDYYVSTAAAAVAGASLTVDGDTELSLPGMDVSVRRFEKYSLEWLVVSVSTSLTAAESTSAASTLTATTSGAAGTVAESTSAASTLTATTSGAAGDGATTAGNGATTAGNGAHRWSFMHAACCWFFIVSSTKLTGSTV